MNERQALELVDNGVSLLNLQRKAHVELQNAINKLDEALDELDKLRTENRDRYNKKNK